MPDVYWFTRYGNYVSYSNIHLHMEQNIPIVELRIIVWEMIIGYALAGNSLDQIIEKCQDSDISLIQYLEKLKADGYNCGGGIDMNPDYARSLIRSGAIYEKNFNAFLKYYNNIGR